MDLVWQIIVALAGAAAVYGGIRSDLKAMHERIGMNESTSARAHDRIDRHIEVFHTHHIER